MRNKKVHIIIIIIFMIIIAGSLYYVLKNPINLGLDLKGGTQIILKPIETVDESVTSESIEKAMLIIMDRIDMLGISEPLVTRDYTNNIIIQLPGVKDPDRAIEVIGKTAQLEFRIVWGSFVSSIGTASKLVSFDAEKGELQIDPEADSVVVIDDLSSESPQIVAELYTDPDTGELLLLKHIHDELEADSAVEDIEEEAAKSSIDAEDIIGKIEYNEDSRELLLISTESGKEGGEILIHSDTGAATLVGPPLLTGDKLAKASAGYDPNGQIVVRLSFKSEGVAAFETITTENIGRQLAIVLDEEIKSAPFIRVAISGGDAVIENIGSLDEANDVALVLQTGALPITLVIEESSTVGPTLGRDALDRGLYAGAIGLILIIVFMLAYYRGLGLVSTLALVVYVLVFWGILAAIGAALTLPGIAGIILTIGMAVDANVIIFERIKEEIGKGKSSRIGISDGFRHAMRTIIDSNVTTLITAAALYRFGTGPIRGFAVTLSLGVVISMVTSLLFTRSILFLMAGISRITTPGFMGVRKKKE